MAGYDYNDTSNSHKSFGDGGGGGGFMASTSFSQGSQSGGQSKKSQTIRPLTIYQISQADQPHPDAENSIDGFELSLISFVGIVRNVSKQTTNISYSLEDGTGRIDVRQWVEASEDEDASNIFENGQHVQVVGNLKSFGGKRHIAASHLQLITDFNQITYHLLECVYVHLFFTRGSTVKSSGIKDVQMQNNDSYSGDGGLVGVPGGDHLQNIHRDILAFIQNSFHKEGVNIHSIKLPQYDKPSIMDAIEYLMNDGLLYTTIDDDHVLPA